MPYMNGHFPGKQAGQFDMPAHLANTGINSIQFQANSHGPWIQMHAAAPKGCTGFILSGEDNRVAGTGHVDIGIGGVGSESIIAHKIYKDWTPANQGLANFGGFFPLRIPEGVPVSMRGYGSTAHVVILNTALVVGHHGPTYQYAEGMSGPFGWVMSTTNWTVIGSSGTRPWKAFMPHISEDGGGQGDANISFGFGYGSGASSFFRRVGRYQANHDMGPAADSNRIPFHFHVEANRALYAYSSVANIVRMSHILFR